MFKVNNHAHNIVWEGRHAIEDDKLNHIGWALYAKCHLARLWEKNVEQ